MSVEFEYLITLYAIAMTILAGIFGYYLVNAKRTLKLLGLVAQARQKVLIIEESVKKTIDEAEKIVKQAEDKIKTAPKTRAATQKAAAKGRAVTQRKVVTPK